MTVSEDDGDKEVNIDFISDPLKSSPKVVFVDEATSIITWTMRFLVFCACGSGPYFYR